jgi:lysylphosphatidylglycerol synthetase-like protein (DUF2156 family)
VAPLSRAGTAAEREALVLAHGYNGMSFLALYPGWEYFHPPEGEGFIAFERHNKVALAVGDPVCSEGRASELIEAFRTFCTAEKLTPAFVAATPRIAELCGESGWNALKIGEEPIFDLDRYAPHGYSAKKMRSDAKRAARDGMTIEIVPAGQRPDSALAREIVEVQQAWQSTRKVSPLSFTLRLAPLRLAEQKLLIVARCNGRIEGFVSGIPIGGRSGYYLEALIRRPGAKGGTCESLFLAAVAECRARGVRLMATGLSPLRNTGEQPAGHRLLGHGLQFTFSKLNVFYKFKPLEHFKAKFGPTEWEDAFLIYRPGRLPRVSMALLRAFTPGKLGPLSAAVSRFKKPTEMGERQFSPGNVAGMLASAALAVGYSLVALQHPLLFAPFDYAGHAFAFPFKEAGEQARAHLVVDSLVLLLGGGWYARSARRDG